MIHSKLQHGVALIVGLLILVIMTLIGISSMSTAHLEEKMAGNARDRELAFQAAESALREAERVVQTNWQWLSFDTNCTNGYCDCDTTDSNSPLSASGCPEYWTDAGLAVWDSPGRHNTYTTTLFNIPTSAKYIIEFLGAFEIPNDPICNTCPKNYYRITAFSVGMTSSAKVMLQSTYRIE